MQLELNMVEIAYSIIDRFPDVTQNQELYVTTSRRTNTSNPIILMIAIKLQNIFSNNYSYH